MTSDTKPHNLLTDALVLAIVPALGYTLTVFHELGYMTYFNMPVNLMRIETPMALITSAYVLMFLLFFLFVLDSFTEKIVSFINNQTSHYFLPAAIVFIGASIPYITRAKLIEDGDNFGLQMACSLFLGLYIPLLFHSSKTPFATRIEESNAKDEKTKYWSRTLLRRLPKPVLTLIVLTLFAISFSYYLGVSEARYQKWFLVPESTPDIVVLRIYGENCITSKFDRPNKKMTPHLTIQPLGDAVPKEASVLSYEPIGPLKPWVKN
jgi:hypothetical protein